MDSAFVRAATLGDFFIMNLLLHSRKVTATGLVFTGACALHSMLLGTDGTNDPEITVYDGIDNTGTEIVPTTTYDASALGLNGFHGGPAGIECTTGIYVVITCAGAVEVALGFKTI